ncbi:MAG: pentapeptide repeat-containing protein [Candidatus Binataceae bacterium]
MKAGSRKRDRAANAVERPALGDVSLMAISLDRLEDEFRCERSIIEEASLSGARASGIVFDTCELRRSGLESSMLGRLRLLDVRLEKCNASNARWEKAHLRRVEFIRCRLTGLSLAAGDVREVVFKDCKADFLGLGASKLKNVRFENCHLADADFQAAELDNAVFLNCDLENSDFGQARLTKVDLRGSVLDGIKLEPNQLRGLIIDPIQALAIVQLLGVTIA